MIHDLCAMNLGVEYQTFRIHQQVTFSATYLLAAIVTALLFPRPGGLGRLVLFTMPGRGWISLRADTQALSLRAVCNFLPGAARRRYARF
jgi:hypothetical protein